MKNENLCFSDIWIPDVLVRLRMGFLNRMQGDKKDRLCPWLLLPKHKLQRMKIRIFLFCSKDLKRHPVSSFLLSNLTKKAKDQSVTHLSFDFFVEKLHWYLRHKLTDKVDKNEDNLDETSAKLVSFSSPPALCHISSHQRCCAQSGNYFNKVVIPYDMCWTWLEVVLTRAVP